MKISKSNSKQIIRIYMRNIFFDVKSQKKKKIKERINDDRNSFPRNSFNIFGHVINYN